MLKLFFLVFVALFVLTIGSGGWLVLQSLPKEDGIDIVPGLEKEVSIIVDDRGVPLIKADSNSDLYRAQGYWTASRRLFQMEFLRRTAKGELSEIFGKQCLPSDRIMRKLGLARMAEKEMELLSPEVERALQEYAAGVNEFISGCGAFGKPLELTFLGCQPQPWTPSDSLVVSKYCQYLDEESWTLDELRQRILDKAGAEVASRLFEQNFTVAVPADSNSKKTGVVDTGSTEKDAQKGGSPDSTSGAKKSPVSNINPKNRHSAAHQAFNAESVYFPASSPLGILADVPEKFKSLIQGNPRYGSNGWAISGGVSDSGGAVLALDRHSRFFDPNIWYACVLNSPDLNVAGVTIPGIPGIIYGRNEKVAWGATALKCDTQDLFVEEFSRKFPDKYKTPEGWAKAKESEELIRFKDGFGSGQELERVVTTRHGPVLLSSDSNAVVLAWSGHDITTPSIETYFKLCRADSWQTFKETLKDYRGTPQSFIFCDKEGNVGRQNAGNIPVRQSSALTSEFSGSLLLPGWTGKCDWVGRLDFDKMPGALNPEPGFVIANFDLISGMSSPASPYPVKRIAGVLNAFKKSGRRAGLPEMAELQGDEFAPLSELVKKSLASSMEKQEINDQFQLSAMKMLDGWDGFLRRQSPSASVYESFLKTIARRVFIAKLGNVGAEEYMNRWPRWSVQVERLLLEKSEDWLPSESRTFDAFIITSFAQSLKSLRLEGKDDNLAKLEWSRFHRLHIKQLLFEGLPHLEDILGFIVNPPVRGIGGDGDTVNTMTVDVRDGNFGCSLGPTVRLLIDMSDDDWLYETQPMGQSGHLLSTNRSDQMHAWINAQPLMMAFSNKQAERQQRHKVIYRANR